MLLVGNEKVLSAELSRHDVDGLPIEIAHASEVISMADVASTAVRAKRDSSIRVAARLVHEQRAQGVISAGNTGAAMALCKVVMGVLPGVHRPALAQVFSHARRHLGGADRRGCKRRLRPGDAC